MLQRQLECGEHRGRAWCGVQDAGVRVRLRRRGLAALIVAGAVWGQAADAQQAHRAPGGTAGPVLTGESAAFRSAAPAAGLTNAVPERATAMALRLENRHKLMIFGTAIFFTGAIIGDDAGTVIMIGGAATALYGLYRTLWPPDEDSSPSGRRQLQGCGTTGARDAGCGVRNDAANGALSLGVVPAARNAPRTPHPCRSRPRARRPTGPPALTACNSVGRESS